MQSRPANKYSETQVGCKAVERAEACVVSQGGFGDGDSHRQEDTNMWRREREKARDKYLKERQAKKERDAQEMKRQQEVQERLRAKEREERTALRKREHEEKVRQREARERDERLRLEKEASERVKYAAEQRAMRELREREAANKALTAAQVASHSHQSCRLRRISTKIC
jgi:colicin import membrane protein